MTAPPVPPSRLHPAFAVVAAALLAASVYAPTLSYGFVVDDLHQIVGNPWVEQPGRWTESFVRGVWDFEGRRSSYYRPMMYGLFAGLHRTAGPGPSGFHLLNVALHAAASGAAAWLAWHLARRAEGAVSRHAATVALAAGALFAVHPIHTEPVAWCAGIVDLGLGATYLAALALYVASDDRPDLRYALALVAFAVALLFKEPAVTLPAALAVYDALFLWRSRGFARTVVRLAPFGAVLAIYLVARSHALGGLAPTAEAARIGLSTYATAVPDLFARYVAKTILPVGLSFWHVYAPPETLFGPRGLAGLAAVVAFLTLAGWSLRRHPAVAFGLALFAVPLAPAFAIGALNQGIANAFTERYLYLPSFGALFALTVVLAELAARRPGLRGAVVATFAVLTVLGVAGCVQRNPVWRDSLTLWSDAVRQAPESAVARANHGFALLYAKRIAEGEAELVEARRLDPDIAQEWVGKGVLYARQGLDAKALLAFHTAIALDPQCAAARFNLGVAYEQRGDDRAALAEYRRAVALEPGNAAYRNNLGIAWARAGRLDLARSEFEEAARLAPSDPEILQNLERVRAAAP